MKKGEKGKRGRQTNQKPQFIDLDSDNEDEEMATRILLQKEDAQIRELERDFSMEECIIQYYKISIIMILHTNKRKYIFKLVVFFCLLTRCHLP